MQRDADLIPSENILFQETFPNVAIKESEINVEKKKS